MEIKKIVLGEKVPEKDDPEYKDKHERCVNAGMKFARKMRLDKAAAAVQSFAQKHPAAFLSIIFTFVLFTIVLNLYRMTNVVFYRQQPQSAVERMEKELHFNRHSSDNPINTAQYEHNGKD